MKPRVATARAITAFIARKSLSVATMIYVGTLAILLIIIWLLAYYFSGWWWLFALPLALISVAAFVIRFIISFIINKIYRHPFSRTQREKLEEFTKKITGLIEAKSTPLPFYAFITIWDILRHRDATTIRSLIDSSRSLKSDYTALEKYFGER